MDGVQAISSSYIQPDTSAGRAVFIWFHTVLKEGIDLQVGIPHAMVRCGSEKGATSMKIRLSIAPMILLAACSRPDTRQASQPAPAANPEPAPAARNSPPSPARVSLPSGTAVHVRLDEAVDTRHNRAGDVVHATVSEPVAIEGRT